MLWIAVTGVLSQVAVLWPASEPTGPARAAAQAAATPPPGFECPKGWRCMPPRGDRPGIRSMGGLFHHLHSGETIGPIGTVISVLSGLALTFFSISGIWLYVRMWRFRQNRKLAPSWFWK
ncbi:MAG: PepSY domain-containing protein [Novosphingobium sp.]